MAEILNTYIIEQAFIAIPVLLILGKILKDTPSIKDWLIPYVLLALGIAFATFLIGFSVDAIIQGVLISGAAVFGNQLYKQFVERS